MIAILPQPPQDRLEIKKQWETTSTWKLFMVIGNNQGMGLL
jgi:hypothetical protein